MNKILSYILILISLISCSKENRLNGKKYIKKTETEIIITLEFAQNENKINGKVVNNYFGNFEINGNNIKFDSIGSTMMLGMPKDMEIEQQFFSFMNDVTNYYIDNNQLILLDKNGKKFIFEKVNNN